MTKIQDGLRTAWDAYQQVAAMRSALTALRAASPPDSTSVAARAIAAFRVKLDSVGGNAEGGRGFGGRGADSGIQAHSHAAN